MKLFNRWFIVIFWLMFLTCCKGESVKKINFQGDGTPTPTVSDDVQVVVHLNSTVECPSGKLDLGVEFNNYQALFDEALYDTWDSGEFCILYVFMKNDNNIGLGAYSYTFKLNAAEKQNVPVSFTEENRAYVTVTFEL